MAGWGAVVVAGVSEAGGVRGGVQEAPKTLFYTLDGIRGVAALLVVSRHAADFFAPVRAQESYLAVDVFFVLSGVVLAQAYGGKLARGTMGVWHFLWIRVVRVWPLYLLGTAISLVAGVTGLIDFGSGRLLAYYAGMALLMIPNPGVGTFDVFPLNNPAWSLALEMGVNVFYGVAARWLSTRRVLAIVALNAVGIALTLVAVKSHTLNFGFWAKSFPFGFCRVGFSFFAGVLLFRYRLRLAVTARNAAVRNVLSALVLVGVAAALAVAPVGRWQAVYDFCAVVVVFPALVAAGMAFQPSGALARVSRFLGLISYAVYTLHAPLAGVVEGVVGAQVGRLAPLSGVVFLAGLVVLCALVDRFFDTPVRRALLRLGARAGWGRVAAGGAG